MLRGRKRWPWQPVQAATAAVTEAISSRGPALLVRLDRLWLLVVGQMLLNEKSQLKPYAHLRGNSSVVKRNRGIGGFTELSYCERTAYRLLAFWSGSTWQGDSKANAVAKDNVPSRARGPYRYSPPHD